MSFIRFENQIGILEYIKEIELYIEELKKSNARLEELYKCSKSISEEYALYGIDVQLPSFVHAVKFLIKNLSPSRALEELRSKDIRYKNGTLYNITKLKQDIYSAISTDNLSKQEIDFAVWIYDQYGTDNNKIIQRTNEENRRKEMLLKHLDKYGYNNEDEFKNKAYQILQYIDTISYQFIDE